ncbi:MAG: FecR domain-containing protein, partial [Panacibacter sp.]
MSNNLHITDDLLVKYMLGEALPAEDQQVNEWLQQDSENQQYYQQFKTIWEQSKELTVTIPIDEKAAWQRFKKRVELKPAEIKKPAPVISFKRWMQAAAAVLIIAVGSLLLYQNFSKPADIVMAQIETFSNTEIDTLPDGSIITVNKNTKLAYPEKFAGSTRKVTLKGEAFFKVQPDKSKPFIITANDVTVTVVGTAFNVKNYDSATEVIVESGIVKVEHHYKTML